MAYVHMGPSFLFTHHIIFDITWYCIYHSYVTIAIQWNDTLLPIPPEIESYSCCRGQIDLRRSMLSEEACELHLSAERCLM
jgi:hypothetical protein